MSQPTDKASSFDPFAAARNARDSWLDSWSRAMVQLVNTEAYAQATGALLDTYLTLSAPYRQAVQSVMTQTLAQLNMPSRSEVASLSERLTNIELRLDDMDARLDTLRPPSKPAARPKASSGTPPPEGQP